jgi:hypothetical protein
MKYPSAEGENKESRGMHSAGVGKVSKTGFLCMVFRYEITYFRSKTL